VANTVQAKKRARQAELAELAGGDSGEAHTYAASDSTALVAAFRAIARSINAVRLTE
jgi:hypothetical protein